MVSRLLPTLALLTIAGCAAPAVNSSSGAPTDITIASPPPADAAVAARESTPTTRLSAVKRNDFRIGDEVEVSLGGPWLPARIVDVVGELTYLVRFDGYGPEYDEVLKIDRLRRR